ncbi:hypothetical protein K438DRAFT_1790513 [Mycena galopus ATCC 62051]|nr:hypothetical protein K438DRAFT_1790513 [Mycena galopus ATCC 62051]
MKVKLEVLKSKFYKRSDSVLPSVQGYGTEPENRNQSHASGPQAGKGKNAEGPALGTASGWLPFQAHAQPLKEGGADRTGTLKFRSIVWCSPGVTARNGQWLTQSRLAIITSCCYVFHPFFKWSTTIPNIKERRKAGTLRRREQKKKGALSSKATLRLSEVGSGPYSGSHYPLLLYIDRKGKKQGSEGRQQYFIVHRLRSRTAPIDRIIAHSVFLPGVVTRMTLDSSSSRQHSDRDNPKAELDISPT